MLMDVVHAYARPRKRRDADCATCRFSEVTRNILNQEVLLCHERMYDPETLKCYLPKEKAVYEA